jgi:hypothetical protein
MFNQSDEIEKLWNRSNEIREEEIEEKINPYRCNACKKQAKAPVVPYCGHIYWYMVSIIVVGNAFLINSKIIIVSVCVVVKK